MVVDRRDSEGNVAMEKAMFDTFKEGTDALERAGVPYVVGGGVAVWAYGRRRLTKDIDLFVKPEDAASALDALSEAGFRTEMTDPIWLYKAFKRDVMVDIIFRSKADIYLDDEALRRGEMRPIDGHAFLFMSPEDLMIRKVFAMSEERRDWYDAISIMDGLDGKIDWQYLVKRAERDPGRVLSFLLYTESEYPRDRALIPFSIVKQLAEIVLDRGALPQAA
ncbi:MAG: nucleotidyltransferase [Chloroflexi bacterium]|nr:nucleotidyltransferase [Chloroflexota bacterium]